MLADECLASKRFPRSSRYHPDWVLASVSGGANSLWLVEWLTESLGIKPGMRVLDLGCGRAASSIFLHREFGVQVWATDLWFKASENLQRVRDAGADGGVFPIHADARSLPFADGFFDAIVSIDSYFYFGTDDQSLNELARFVKPGGLIGIAQATFLNEIEPPVPAHMQAWWSQDRPWILHSPSWWQRHWEKTEILDIERVDVLDDGWRYWLEWQKTVAPGNTIEIAALEADHGRNFGYLRAVGRRRIEAPLQPPIDSISMEYVPKPLLRDDASLPQNV